MSRVLSATFLPDVSESGSVSVTFGYFIFFDPTSSRVGIEVGGSGPTPSSHSSISGYWSTSPSNPMCNSTSSAPAATNASKACAVVDERDAGRFLLQVDLELRPERRRVQHSVHVVEYVVVGHVIAQRITESG